MRLARLPEAPPAALTAPTRLSSTCGGGGGSGSLLRLPVSEDDDLGARRRAQTQERGPKDMQRRGWGLEKEGGGQRPGCGGGTETRRGRDRHPEIVGDRYPPMGERHGVYGDGVGWGWGTGQRQREGEKINK